MAMIHKKPEMRQLTQVVISSVDILNIILNLNLIWQIKITFLSEKFMLLSPFEIC